MEILRMFGIQLQNERIQNDELIACCPFHTERTASFFLNIPGGYFHCFGCGEKGYITELVEHLTNLTIDQIKDALKGKIPEGVKVKVPVKKEPKYMTDKEIDLLTWYMTGLNILLLDKFKMGDPSKRPDVSVFRDYIINDRGISEAAIEHFKLGASVHALINDGKPRKDQFWYWQQFAVEATEHLGHYHHEVVDTLKELNLINARNNDYWFRPAIIIPYMYGGQVYWAEARTLPQYVDPQMPIRYMGMKGIVRECFWNEDALDNYDEIYVVEGAINGLSLWCHGIENAISFGSKNQLTDELIWRLWGKRVILYMDADKNDADNKVRSETIAKIQEIAASVSYLDLLIGEDINDAHRQTSHDIFMTEILGRTVEVVDPDNWLPHEVRERQDKENVISLAEAQRKNHELMTNIGSNLKYYIGSKVLNNMPVGTGKTTATIAGMNVAPRRVPKLVALGQHNLATEYIERLDTDSIVHLYGRTHKVVDCLFKDDAEILCSKGYSVYFKLHYCLGKCSKADVCIHLENARKAKFAEVLITMHSHVELMDFLMNDYYGNNLRQMVVIDEAPKLVKDIYFSKRDIYDNLCRFRNLTAKLKGKGLLFVEHVDKAEALVQVLEGMDKVVNEREEYIASLDTPNLPIFNRHFVNSINRIVRVDLSASRIPRFILNELTYALNKKLRLRYDGINDALFYTWRPIFSRRACTIFLSATTSQAYLENQLDDEIDVVLGEQFYVQRENLRVVQLMNLSGSRQRLMNTTKEKMSSGDAVYRENLRLTLRLLLKKYPEHKIVIATSLGGKTELNANKTDEKPLTRAERKENVMQMLRAHPERSDRWIASDTGVNHETIRKYRIELESGGEIRHLNILIGKDGKKYPRGTSHQEPASSAAQGKATAQTPPEYTGDYGWAKVRLIEMLQDVAVECGKMLVPVTDENYPDLTREVNLYIQNNSEADMEQLEGRILRGEDTFKLIFRLHNVNISPYPDEVYKSWQMMFKGEFGYVKPKELKGKAKQTYEWLIENASGREFTVKELVDALGGYRQSHQRMLKQLEAIGYVKETEKGQQGRGNTSTWKLA